MSLTSTGILGISSTIILLIFFIDYFFIGLFELSFGIGIMALVFIGSFLICAITIFLRVTGETTWTEDDYDYNEYDYDYNEDEDEDYGKNEDEDEDEDDRFPELFSTKNNLEHDNRINELLDERHDLKIKLRDTDEEMERSRIMERIRQIEVQLEKL